MSKHIAKSQAALAAKFYLENGTRGQFTLGEPAPWRQAFAESLHSGQFMVLDPANLCL